MCLRLLRLVRNRILHIRSVFCRTESKKTCLSYNLRFDCNAYFNNRRLPCMQGYVKTLTLKVRVIYITEAVDVIYIIFQNLLQRHLIYQA